MPSHPLSVPVGCGLGNATGNRRKTHWNPMDTEQLEDLDFADDLALLSHSHQQMQEKTSRLEEVAAVTGLIINRDKTKMMRLLKSKVISRHTKIRLFNSNVKTVLLYGSETWRVTKALSKRVQIFLNRSLRRILNIKWQDKITNEEVWAATNQQPIETTIRGRKWRWIGHTLRRDGHCITKQALRWVPQGNRNRGRPTNTWRRSVDGEMKAAGFSWNQLERTAQDRVRWRNVVTGLCSTGD